MILFGLIIFMVMILSLRDCGLFRIFGVILLGFRRILCSFRDIIRLTGFLTVLMIGFFGKDLLGLKGRCDRLVGYGFEEEMKDDVVFDCFVAVEVELELMA